MTNSKNKHLVAVACADLHFYHKAPLARSCEEDWLEVQWGYLRQLQEVARKGDSYPSESGLPVSLGVPVLIAGDLFDRAVVAPEVVNLLLQELPPRTYAIAGNHDLPNHRYEALGKCSYGTLVAAGKVIDVKPGESITIEGPTPIRLHGFPCGVDVKPLDKPHDLYLEIALVHAYIWTKNTGYPGAPEEKRARCYTPDLAGYDIAIFGDNHIPFEYQPKEGAALVYNCGGFLRRKSDEKFHQPSVGLIYSDGNMERYYLDCSHDKFLEGEEVLRILDGVGANGFIESLLELGDAALDFREAVKHLLAREKVDSRVKGIILKALEGDKK
jgi:hypothetical protein